MSGLKDVNVTLEKIIEKYNIGPIIIGVLDATNYFLGMNIDLSLAI